MQTGLRTGELVGFRWSDVDLENRLLTINRSMEYRHSTGEWRVGEPKSKSGYCTIPLTEEAVEILKLQKQKNRTFKVIPMLGHSNIGITMNLYVHTTEEQKHKEIDLVADALKVI